MQSCVSSGSSEMYLITFSNKSKSFLWKLYITVYGSNRIINNE